MILAGIVALFLQSVTGAWKVLMVMEGSIGIVNILRWTWWRINAWSEISSMLASGNKIDLCNEM
jgi:SSS family solute:Na+ symporter